jgi:hypothetical protein
MKCDDTRHRQPFITTAGADGTVRCIKISVMLLDNAMHGIDKFRVIAPQNFHWAAMRESQ